jgi:hypothetical protein
MAKYRALAALYVGSRLLAPGDVFQSDDVPGMQWQPLDDEGKPIPAAPAAKPEAKPAPAKPEPAADKRVPHKAADKKDD